MGLYGLTADSRASTIAVVAKRGTGPFEEFGLWATGLRRLSGRTQERASAESRVSLDSIRRIERGEMPGGAHLLGLLSWLMEQPKVHNSTSGQRFAQELLSAGQLARASSLAYQQPKAKNIKRRARAPSGKRPAATKRAG